MKKGFSMIEILQTIVLLGIIAGISISFFKKINVDEKLYFETEKQLSAAIQEAGRQMCSDDTPVCATKNADGTYTLNKLWSKSDSTMKCSTIYPDSTYNETTHYCESSATTTPTPVSTDVAAMTKDSTGKWVGIPYCETTTTDNTDPANPITTTKYTATVPYSAVICPDGKPDYTKMRYDYPNETELCYRLHSLINHKDQTDKNDTTKTDLYMTCENSTNICLTNNSCDNITDKTVNMILPNGVRLYNMKCFNNSTCTDKALYVKYDRVSDLRSVSLNTKERKVGDNTYDKSFKKTNTAKIILKIIFE